jgi:hypothetical protein
MCVDFANWLNADPAYAPCTRDGAAAKATEAAAHAKGTPARAKALAEYARLQLPTPSVAKVPCIVALTPPAPAAGTAPGTPRGFVARFAASMKGLAGGVQWGLHALCEGHGGVHGAPAATAHAHVVPGAAPLTISLDQVRLT